MINYFYQMPSFDTWTIIFLFAAVQGIFVSSFLWLTKKENRFNNILVGLIIFLFSLTLIEYVGFWTKYQLRFPHLMNISGGFPFLFGVVLFLYFRNVFEQKKITARDLLHFLPFVLYVLLRLPEYTSSAEVKFQWMQGQRVMPSLFHWPFSVRRTEPVLIWMKIMHMIIYAGLIFFSYNKMSKTNPAVRTWFQWINVLFIAFIASFSSYYVLIEFPAFNRQWDYMISFSMMAFIYFTAWFGYLQPKVFSGLTLTEAIQQPRYKNSPLTPELSRELLLKLENTIHDKKLYRENDIRLDKLATAMNISRHHLSQLLNEQKGMSFFEYINHLRIEEAKELLAQTSKKELNVIDVAYSVGFNNKVSFNTTFKKATGKTPTEFRKQFELSKTEVN